MSTESNTEIIRHKGREHIVPLSPCPMCGSEADLMEHTEAMVWTAECPECGLQLGWPYGYGSRLDLCADWNRRKP